MTPPRKIATDDPDWEEFVHEWNNLVDFILAIAHNSSPGALNQITTRGTFRLPSKDSRTVGESSPDGDARWQ